MALISFAARLALLLQIAVAMRDVFSADPEGIPKLETAASALLQTQSGTFPEELGPFYLFDAGFPKLDEKGDRVPGKFLISANTSGSASGHWAAGDASGVLSEEKHGALPGLEKAFGLAEGSIHRHAWAYPDPSYAENPGLTQQSRFKKSGGFIFFNDCNEIVAVKIAVGPWGVLKFGVAEECPSCSLDECPGESGFLNYHPVPAGLSALVPHATHFCWLPPATCSRASQTRHRDGCFAFKKKHSNGFMLFPVATEQAPGQFPKSLGPFFLATAHDELKLLSQWSPLTMPVSVRNKIGIPEKATSMMWAYPTGRKELEGLTSGGFLFNKNHGTNNLFMDNLHVEGVDAAGGTEMKIISMEYKIAFSQTSEESFTLESCADWHDVASKNEAPGAKRYCWSGLGGGSFIYEMEDGSVISFPMESRQLSAP